MNNKKSKKKLFAIIGGSALAFILTVVVSVAVTLAYFGDTGNGDTTITMGQALLLTEDSEGAKVTASTTLGDDETVLPGAAGDITVSASIAQTSTKAYLRAKVATSGDTSSITVGALSSTLGDFVEVDGYYYLAVDGGDTAATVDSLMQELDATSGAKDVSFTIAYEVSPELTNEVENDKITVTVTIDIIQSANLVEGNATVTAVSGVWAAEDTVFDDDYTPAA